MNAGALVVGYGNVLRSDDGVGWQVAELLAHDPRAVGVTVLHVHQLTPDLALDVSGSSVVVLVDAQHGPPPGSIEVGRVPQVDDTSTTWSHHLDPASLMGLARELYGAAPEAFTVGVGIESLDTGDLLSPAVSSALPDIVDAVVALVASRGATAVEAGELRHA